jgi:membrane protease YdiL (CAAX protease family)
MIDRKGIYSFLAITFIITYTIEGILIISGFRITDIPAMYGQLVIAGVMWVPALATVLTIKFITHEGFAITNLRFGSWKPYLATWIIIPSCFFIIYVITWMLGLGEPDWMLSELMSLMASSGADMSTAPAPSTVSLSLFMASLFITPFINSIFGFGEEFGWRGYLLPKLMPLGKPVAYLLLGVIWGLWHAPLIAIGFMAPGYPILGILLMIGLTTTIGLYINELSLRYRSSILAGWIHGVFNSQSYGIWRLLFLATGNPLIGGLYGLVGLTVWLVLGLLTVRFVNAPAPSDV